MAEGTQVISNVIIKVSANTTSTKSKIDKLKTSFNSLRDTAKGIKTAFQNNFGVITGLISSVQKMVTRMALRTLVKSLFGGLEEGLKNYIHYSAEAKASADQFATATNYMKNSLGAALMPVLQQLIPCFVQLVDWVVKGIEAFSMWFAYINGKSTYTKATNVFTEWTDDSEEATKETKKNIKEIKRSLMGFDEINALSKQAEDTTSSTTSDDKAKDYSTMFEEAAIDANTVNKFEEILKYAKFIAGAIALWKLAGFLSDLGKVGDLIAGLAMVAVGVYFTYNGFLDYFKSGGTDKTALYKGLGGVLATVLGSTLVGFTIGGPTGAVIGLLAGIAISAGTILFAWQQAKMEQNDLYKLSQEINERLSQYMEDHNTFQTDIKIQLNAVTEITSKQKDAVDLIDKLYDILEKGSPISTEDAALINNYLSQLSALGFEDLVKQIGNVEDGFKLTRQEAQGLLNDLTALAIKEAASSNLTQATSDKYTIGKDLNEARGNAKKAKEALKLDDLTAYAEEFTDAAEMASYELFGTTDYKSYFNDYDKMLQIAQKMIEYGNKPGLLTDGNVKATHELLVTWIEADKAVATLEEDYVQASGNVTYWASVASGAWDGVTQSILTATSEGLDTISLYVTENGVIIRDSLGNTYTDTIHTVDEIKTYIENTSPEMSVEIIGDTSGIDKTVSTIESYSISIPVTFTYTNSDAIGTGGATTDVAQMLGTTNPVVNSIKEWKASNPNFDENGLNTFIVGKHGVSLSKWQLDQIKANWASFATGGFPEDGLFYANHNELVGKFSNGKTAVANNEQIIAGIRQGVADGMNDANNGQGQGGDWTIQIVTPDGTIKGEEVITALMRYNQRAGKSVVDIH